MNQRIVGRTTQRKEKAVTNDLLRYSYKYGTYENTQHVYICLYCIFYKINHYMYTHTLRETSFVFLSLSLFRLLLKNL